MVWMLHAKGSYFILFLLGSKRFDTQMSAHTATQNTDANLAQGFQKHLSNESCKHGIIDHGKPKNFQ